MDHNYINKFDLVDRYVMGKLAEDEGLAFEEHFVDCPNCIEQIKITEKFVYDLRHEVIQSASRSESTVGTGPLRDLRRIFSGKMLVLAAASLMILLVAAAAIREVVRLRSEVAQTKDVSKQWESRYDQQRQAASESDKKHEDTERDLTGRLNELEALLQNRGKGPDGGFEDLTNPRINMQIIPLQNVRGDNSKLNEIRLPKSARSFAIVLPVTEEKYKQYRVTIKNDQGQSVWTKDGLAPQGNIGLTIEIGSGFLHSGRYQVIVEGGNNKSNFQPVAEYPMHIIKNP